MPQTEVDLTVFIWAVRKVLHDVVGDVVKIKLTFLHPGNINIKHKTFMD